MSALERVEVDHFLDSVDLIHVWSKVVVAAAPNSLYSEILGLLGRVLFDPFARVMMLARAQAHKGYPVKVVASPYPDLHNHLREWDVHHLRQNSHHPVSSQVEIVP